jgi:hypothetical protein
MHPTKHELIRTNAVPSSWPSSKRTSAFGSRLGGRGCPYKRASDTKSSDDYLIWRRLPPLPPPHPPRPPAAGAATPARLRRWRRRVLALILALSASKPSRTRPTSTPASVSPILLPEFSQIFASFPLSRCRLPSDWRLLCDRKISIFLIWDVSCPITQTEGQAKWTCYISDSE